jgi:drug/metabolite transporter (DMT)-like permease
MHRIGWNAAPSVTVTLLLLLSAESALALVARLPVRTESSSSSSGSQSFLLLHCRRSPFYQPRQQFHNRHRLWAAKQEDSAVPVAPVDAAVVVVTDSTAPYFNGTHEIIPVMFDPAIAAAGSDAIMPSMEGDGTTSSSTQPAWIKAILTSYWGPRLVLAAIPAIYGTNFALGSLMNDALPASAVTATRMTLATLALAPFVWQIKPQFWGRAMLTGCFTALGYVTQSIALVDADPARVSFLGSATVLWLPVLESTIDKTPMGWKDSPQTWLAALLCILGVGILEFYDPASGVWAIGDSVGWADVLALLQAVGFGTSVFLSAKMVREEPSQVLPVTSVLIVTTTVLSWIWCAAEGSLGPLQALFSPTTDPAVYTPVLAALLWTGVVSTSLNFVVEVAALGYVPSSEAAVLLASEPVWAAIFAALLLGETFGLNDYLGGSFIVAACLVNAILKPSDIFNILNLGQSKTSADDTLDTDSKSHH